MSSMRGTEPGPLPTKTPPSLRTRYPTVYEKPPGNKLCNICQKTVDDLTEDHVPPRSCLLDLDVELEPFEHRLRAKKPKLQASQSGVRYRTIWDIGTTPPSGNSRSVCMPGFGR